MKGWIKLHRKILEWEWYQDANTVRLFIHLLLKANHKPKKWQGIDIEAGQLIASRITLSKELGLSQQQIRTSLKKLEKCKNITTKSTNKNTFITVCNYCNFQHENDSEQPADQQTDNKRITNKQQTDNKQITTNKNVNNKKNDKKDITPLPPKGGFEIPDGINKKTWLEYETMRKKIKKPMTDHAKNLAVKKLITINKKTGQCPNEILEQSILNSWQGLFELKTPSNQNNGVNNGKPNHHESNTKQTLRVLGEISHELAKQERNNSKDNF